MATSTDPAGPIRKRLRTTNEPDESADPLVNRREKARERQRKKRERDRSGMPSTSTVTSPSIPVGFHEPPPTHNIMPLPAPPVQPVQQISHQHQSVLTPDEAARKEKVRLAARERQRKHRAVVKARRMAELGLAILPANPNDPLGYRLNENGQMEPVHDANALAQGQAGVTPTYQATPGQTFAHLLMTSTLLNHNLKQHLLRTLQMTTEELASFEPIIAAAWEHWNHQRMHYIQTAGQAEASNTPFGSPSPNGNGEGPANEEELQYSSEQTNEYRNRFHKTLTDPSPFQQLPAATASDSDPAAQSNSIDPTLAAQAGRETSSMRNRRGEEYEPPHSEDIARSVEPEKPAE